MITPQTNPFKVPHPIVNSDMLLTILNKINQLEQDFNTMGSITNSHCRSVWRENISLIDLEITNPEQKVFSVNIVEQTQTENFCPFNSLSHFPTKSDPRLSMIAPSSDPLDLF